MSLQYCNWRVLLMAPPLIVTRVFGVVLFVSVLMVPVVVTFGVAYLVVHVMTMLVVANAFADPFVAYWAAIGNRCVLQVFVCVLFTL